MGDWVPEKYLTSITKLLLIISQKIVPMGPSPENVPILSKYWFKSPISVKVRETERATSDGCRAQQVVYITQFN